MTTSHNSKENASLGSFKIFIFCFINWSDSYLLRWFDFKIKFVSNTLVRYQPYIPSCNLKLDPPYLSPSSQTAYKDAAPSNIHQVNNRAISVCVVGAGNRGSLCASFALQNQHLMKLVALACPTDFRRYNLAQRHAIPPEMTFSDWRELCSKPKLADAVIITSVDDRIRDRHMIVFAEKRYHILLESPATLSLQTCKKLADSARRHQVIFAMGNALRYTAYNLTIKRILDSGTIGEVMNIQHVAPLGAFRLQSADSGIFARKYRRESSSMMANSLSDVDLVSWFMGRRCRIISSFGSFFSQSSHLDNNSFVSHNSSISGPSSSPTISFPSQTENENGILSLITSDTPQASAVNSPLEENGHQNINMEFDGDKTCSITLIACPENVLSRRTRIFGNLGELDGDGEIVRVFNFLTRRSEIIRPEVFRGGDILNGKYCGEYGLVRKFVEAIAAGESMNGYSDAEEILDSYVYVAAAEHANKTESVVNVDDFRCRVFGEA